MVKQFREAATEKFGENYFSAENHFGAPFAPKSGHVRTVEHPSWWEFVQWLIANKKYPERFDEHWKPFSLHCAVCSLPYNYILKFENLWEEEEGLFEEMGVADQVPREWMNKGVGTDEENLVKSYLSLLEEDDIDQLAEIYRLAGTIY